MLSEKRSSNRLEFDGIVQVHDLLHAPGGFKTASAPPLHLKGINISKDGICLKTDYFFIPNQIFQLDFEYMNKAIHTIARVVWSEKTTCGLQFMKPEEVVDIFRDETQNIRQA